MDNLAPLPLRGPRARRWGPIQQPVLAVTLLATALLWGVPLGGCSRQARVEHRSETRDDPVDGDTRTESTAIEFTDPIEARFEEAARAARERHFDAAISIYREIYRNAPGTEERARALLRWAQVENHLLNPDRDPDAALARLDLLIEQFPQSEAASEAELERSRLRATRKHTP